MKAILIVIGVILIAGGIYVAAGQGSYTSQKDVLKVGGLEASVKESHALPPWAGFIAIVAGAGLAFAAVKR